MIASSVPRGIPRPAADGPRRQETDLIRRMLAGSEAARDDFADTYLPGLYRFALRKLRGDRELTRDLVQATAVKVLDRLDSFRGDSPLFTWLCACCANEIRMHFRGLGRRPPFEEVEEGITAAHLEPGSPAAGRAGGDPERRAARREERRHVHDVLDGLPPRYARALDMKYLEERSVAAIAEELEMSPKAAESLLTRARRAFEASYETRTRGGAPPPEVSGAGASAPAPRGKAGTR